jgi:hypothetical protein
VLKRSGGNLRRLIVAICLSISSASFAAKIADQPQRENVIFVMTDGLRWQEVFNGADVALMTKENGKVTDPAALKAEYWRDSAEERRAALMPFLWNVLAKDGQIYGNRAKGSEAFVTNGFAFSYPGYNEALCGFPDPRIHSNDKIPNPNVTVLEWLNGFADFRGQVAAFGAWDVIGATFNPARSGLIVNAGWDPFLAMKITPRLGLLNELKVETPRIWDDEPFDALPFYTALEYLNQRKPKVLYISLGETDNWAHEGRYDEYLNAAHRVDDYLHKLWTLVQEMPEYRGQTTLIVSIDHGRGEGPLGWKDHGEKAPDSKYIWVAILGPNTPPLGERTNISPITQSQIAATLALAVSKNYQKAVPQAGEPIVDALKTAKATEGNGK